MPAGEYSEAMELLRDLTPLGKGLSDEECISLIRGLMVSWGIVVAYNDLWPDPVVKGASDAR